MNNNNVTTQDLVNLSVALSNAVVTGRFMSAEHAKTVWLKFLRDAGVDVPRKIGTPPVISEKTETK